MKYIDINKRVSKTNYSMHELHLHPHYEIYFLTKGSRMLVFSNCIYEVTAPAIIIIPPQTLHKTEGGVFTRYNMIFYPQNLNKFQKYVLDKYELLLIKPDKSFCEKIIELFEEFIPEKSDKYSSEIAETIFSYFIYEISKIKDGISNKTINNDHLIPPTILKVMHYLNNNLDKNITLDALCEKFFIAKSTLNYNFKRYTSYSPIEYFLNLKLEKAKQLLRDSKKSIEEISAECGFSSSNYFGTIFKNHIGTSPATYRKTDR